MTWTRAPGITRDWNLAPAAVRFWPKDATSVVITYWDLRQTGWDDNGTIWDVGLDPEKIWIRQ